MDGSLPELRTDWLLGRSVLVAENRAQRPNEFGESVDAGAAEKVASTGERAARVQPVAATARHFACPFCGGQEHRTPPAVLELTDGQGRWRTRVVPNMFPAVVSPESAAAIGGQNLPGDAMRPEATAVAALGAHEVIIESPHHVDRLSLLSFEELRGVLETYARRLRHWRDTGRFAYGLIFKNQGPRAGASLAHLHSQLIALPGVPPAVAAESERAARRCSASQACPYCRLIAVERAAAVRMIRDADGFVALCPFASLQPYEAWLLSVEHAPFFEDLQPEDLDRLANVLSDLTRRIEAIVPESAYNLLLRSSPWQVDGHQWHHWRIEILPRISAMAGFELASGMFINSVAPERAASKLRSI